MIGFEPVFIKQGPFRLHQLKYKVFLILYLVNGQFCD